MEYRDEQRVKDILALLYNGLVQMEPEINHWTVVAELKPRERKQFGNIHDAPGTKARDIHDAIAIEVAVKYKLLLNSDNYHWFEHIYRNCGIHKYSWRVEYLEFKD